MRACVHKVSEEHRGNPTLVSGGQEEGERGGSREHDLPNLGRLPYLLACLLVCCSVPYIAIKLGSGAHAYSSNLSVGGFGQHSMYKQGRLKVASVGSPRYSSCFSTMREDLSTWEPA